MSYDLMVFEPQAAPKDHVRFLAWYREQTKWNEGHSYGDPAVTSSRLRDWFLEMNRQFPTLNGVSAEDELPQDEATAADYSIGKEIIYAAFAWSKAAEAYAAVFSLAKAHGVGFFNVSSEGEAVWLPDGGDLVLAHQKEKPSLLHRMRRLLGVE
jgi:hypothetical protein